MAHNGNPPPAPVDLRSLIETWIPAKRSELEETSSNLKNVAQFCEDNYIMSKDKNMALEQTKQYALQSLASVAYQIDTLAKGVLDMVALQTDQVADLTTAVAHASMSIDLHKERLARRDIGMLTTNKSVPKQQKIIMPDTVDPPQRYKRVPIDYAILDHVGHGTRAVECGYGSTRGTISRVGSSVSGVHVGSAPSSHYASYSHYQSPANNMSTLSRATMRAAALSSVQQEHHYRVPQTVPVVDNVRLSSQTSLSSGYHIGTSSSVGSGYSGDRYGTLRVGRQDSRSSQGAHTPTLNRMSPVVHGNVNILSYNNGHSNGNDLPLPPPSALLSGDAEDEDLPPPPSLFDTTSDWVPRDYIEKVMALYDYDANKADELSLRANCVVYVIRKNEDGWYEGVLDGVTGLFPGNYVASA